MGWMTPWVIGELTPYPELDTPNALIDALDSAAELNSTRAGANWTRPARGGESREQIYARTGAPPNDEWVSALSRE